MARYNPFFEKAGMTRVHIPPSPRDRAYQSAMKRLQELGFTLELLASKQHSRQIMQHLTPPQRQELRRLILRHFVSSHFRKPRLVWQVQGGDPAAMAEALQGYRLPSVYLIWDRSRMPQDLVVPVRPNRPRR
jgi:hypothetical protein